MLFPFLRHWFAPRNVTSSPQAWYKPIRTVSDDNARNAYESTVGPPFLSVAARGNMVGQCPGVQGAYFLPGVTVPVWSRLGGIPTGNVVGGGPLIATAASSPQTELF